MKIKFLRNYKKKETGRTVFVYTVHGTKEQLDTYKTAQGDNFTVDDDGVPLFFSTRYHGASAPLLIAKNSGKPVVDMSAFDQVQSLCEQYPALASAIAQQGIAKLLGNSGTAQAPKVQAPSEDGGLDS